MKIVVGLIFLSLTLLYGKEAICVVPKNLKKQIAPLFNNEISYTNMQVILKDVDVENTVIMMNDIENIKFAIIRKDILWQLEEFNQDKKESYVTISELPYNAQLFFLQNENSLNIEINMLEKKIVSIGLLEDKNINYIKKLLEMDKLRYSLFYKSVSYQKSIVGLKEGLLDGYFTFLPIPLEQYGVNIQSLFSKRTIKTLDKYGIFNIKYNEIFSPYVLIASKSASDEEIENIIYRLMEKNIFNPVTDTRFGPINQYVVTQLESVKRALEKKEQANMGYKDKICKKYHYGFLKLLREKPKIKKKLKYIKQSNKYLKNINKILLDIDTNKLSCNLEFLERKKEQFYKIMGKLK